MPGGETVLASAAEKGDGTTTERRLGSRVASNTVRSESFNRCQSLLTNLEDPHSRA
jgi:hypothetical protein